MDNEKIGHRGEAYLLLLASLLGMNLMAASADLVMLYLAIETTSIPLYVLAGFMLADDEIHRSRFQVPALRRVDLDDHALRFQPGLRLYRDDQYLSAGRHARRPAVCRLSAALGVLALILVGLGFKVSIVPFHFWAPDVYEGAPTPVAGFLSTASKAAGFAVLLRLFFVAFPRSSDTSTSWHLWALPWRSFPRSP